MRLAATPGLSCSTLYGAAPRIQGTALLSNGDLPFSSCYCLFPSQWHAHLLLLLLKYLARCSYCCCCCYCHTWLAAAAADPPLLLLLPVCGCYSQGRNGGQPVPQAAGGQQLGPGRAVRCGGRQVAHTRAGARSGCCHGARSGGAGMARCEVSTAPPHAPHLGPWTLTSYLRPWTLAHLTSYLGPWMDPGTPHTSPHTSDPAPPHLRDVILTNSSAPTDSMPAHPAHTHTYTITHPATSLLTQPPYYSPSHLITHPATSLLTQPPYAQLMWQQGCHCPEDSTVPSAATTLSPCF